MCYHERVVTDTGAATPCLYYSSNLTACAAQLQRCQVLNSGCVDIPPTTTSTTTSTTTTVPTTVFVRACETASTPLCAALSTCQDGAESGNYTCTPCPMFYTGDPYVACTGATSSLDVLMHCEFSDAGLG